MAYQPSAMTASASITGGQAMRQTGSSPTGGLGSQFKIGTRIGAGFTLILALLLAAGGTGLVGIQSIDTASANVSRVSHNMLHMEQLRSSFYSMRREILYFALHDDEAAAHRAEDIARSLREQVAQLQHDLSIPDVKQTVATFAGAVDIYANGIPKLIQLDKTSVSTIANDLDPAGAEARKKLTEVTDALMAGGDEHGALAIARLNEELLLLRLSAMRFFDAPDAKALAEVEKYGEAFQRMATGAFPQVANAGQRSAAEAAVKLVTTRFFTGFRTASTARLEFVRLLDSDMLKAATGASKALDTGIDLQKSRVDALETKSDADTAFLTTAAFVVCGVSLALGIVLAWLIARGITAPVGGMTEAMVRLARGDKSTEIPGSERGDEIGEMASAVEVFKQNMIEADNLRAEQEETKKRLEAERRATTLKMADDFEASVGGVVQTVSSAATEMEASAQSLSSTAEETTKQATAVAAASEEASANVQTVAAAAEELSNSITEISRQVSQSSKIASNAVVEAERANQMVQGLVSASQKIGQVVALITDIADQTNLLALNATIEAARAGEAGKGFAVVAAEVKNLANQTAKATEDIAAQITGVQGATQEAVKAIETISSTIGEINQIASGIAAAVEEQGAATKEIARNVEQASAGTQEVSTNIVGVNQAANDTGSSATQVLGAARDLSQQSEALRGLVQKFLGDVRAA